MKVAMIIPSLLTGGGQKVAMDIATDDPRFIFIVVGERVDTSFSRQVEETHKVYYLNKKLGFNPTIFLKIWKVLKKEKPNVVHFHLGVSLYGLVPCFFLPKISLVYTFHTVAEKDSDGLIRKLCRMGIKYRKMVPVAITETVKESIEKTFDLENVRLIYNGIDIDHYYKAPKMKSSNCINLVAVGQIWEAKNHAFLVDVMAELSEDTSEKEYYLRILGDGPLRKSLESYIHEKKMDQYIELVGNVDNVNDYLANADIFVLSSLYEGLSLATMEAMASHLPIVSTDVGGMKDLVTDNGYLIHVNKVPDFASKIRYLGKNSDIREMMGERSVVNVMKYDKKTMREKYLLLYNEIGEN